MTELLGLDELRDRLGETDAAIIEGIRSRFEVIREIGEYKRAHGIPMMNSDRVGYVTGRYAAALEQYGLSRDVGIVIAEALIQEACRIEDEIIEGRGADE